MRISDWEFRRVLFRSAQRRIIIASDKFTNAEFLDDLLLLKESNPDLKIEMVTGNEPSTIETLENQHYASLKKTIVESNPDKSGKMHNKFIIIDDNMVITGSPNTTYAAYNYNIKSFVVIE